MKKTIIGLTGPIASGKNEAAKAFIKHGARVIDADVIGHKVLFPQSKAWHKLVKLFGVKVLKRGGVVNRRKLGSIVFSDNSNLKKLEKFTHPEMVRRIMQEVKAADKKIVVINAAVLYEMKLLPKVDKIVSVLSSKALRLKRLIRKGLSKHEAMSRIRSQKSDPFYKKIADYVIINNGSLKELHEKTKRIVSKF